MRQPILTRGNGVSNTSFDVLYITISNVA